MKKLIALLAVMTLIFTFTACTGDIVQPANTVPVSPPANEAQNETNTEVGEGQNTTSTYIPVSVEYDSDDMNSNWDNSEMSGITLAGNSITLEGDGATVDGSKIIITSAGTYGISGTLDDGQIIVNTEDKETVRLVLNGVDITCSTSAPIYVMSAKKTIITLADGTENYITDGDFYTFEYAESDEPNAAIFSKSDLTINGDGSLTVEANYNNGIQSKDDLKIIGITGSTITVNAVNDGIKGKDCIALKDVVITVDAGGDGMQSTNDGDSGKGFVAIEGGFINVTAGEDGIQAETSILINGVNIAISSGGGSVNSSTGDTWGDWGPRGMVNNFDSGDSFGSAKGIKSGVDVTIEGDNIINIDSSDDSIHSNDSLTINSGNIILTSGDDGIHSDSTLEINGGDISITKSYEGIESSVITINDGNIHLVASDDGINAAGGVDSSSIGGRPGQNNFNPSGNHYLYLNGGYIFIDATGDGLDINGSIDMSGGVVIVNGPTSNNNGALDYLGAFEVTDGFIVTAGSSGMAQAPGTSSTQYSVMLNLPSSQPSNTMFHIETEDGEEILTFVPTKSYQSVVLCSPELKNGVTYIVYTGGSSTGTVTDSLYFGGTYTAGTQITSFTISNMVTSTGSSGGGFPGGRPGGMRR
ncbi:MAG: carbohydrate-binding domain-containing protein [Dehalococcoidales bacterium]|jgi:hypothetical protein